MFNRRRVLGLGATAALGSVFAARPGLAQSARRRLSLYNERSLEFVTVDYWIDGWYDPEAMAALSRLFRDSRTGEAIAIDPELFDTLHLLQTRIGTEAPLQIRSGYRSPESNAALARRRRGVASNSYHIYGRAADIRLPGYSLRRLRDHALELGRGGVGYYGRSDFVHIDTGPVRHWG